VFDILALKGRDVSTLPLVERRKILDKALKRSDHISTSPAEAGSSAKILTFVRQHGLEGVVAKRLDSLYEPGKRSGAWCKYRINLGQEFVVGGYTPGGNGFDALILGFYRGKDFFDATGIFAIEEIITDFKRHGAAVLLVEVRPNVRYKLDRGGIIAHVGQENVIDSLEQALLHAKELQAGMN
jgi:ATP-dependent DNA ligase